MKNIKITYYSGTGGTKLASEVLNNGLVNKNYKTKLERLGHEKIIDEEFYDLNILLFPVHAANAPHIVYKWIKQLPKGNENKFAVISVSAGGEVIINRAARLSTIKLLEKKSYKVVYENSLIMPSNLFIPTPDDLSKMLVKVLPEKIDLIITDLQNEKIRRVKPPIIDRCISKILEVEKLGAKILGKTIKVNQSCNGCGLCEKNCYCKNIIIENKKPRFKSNCCFCTACFYVCPKKSLSPRFFSNTLLKEGYNIDKFIEQSRNENQISKDDVIDLTQSILWSGLRQYILESRK